MIFKTPCAVKEINLTQGLITMVDDSDFDMLSSVKWRAEKNGKYGKWYAISSKNPKVYMHQMLLILPIGFQVDHEDGNSLNNQRYNLRKSTHSQNGANRKVKETKECRYLGVHKRSNGNYQALSRKNYKRYSAGTFKTQEAAALAYNSLAVRLHGEFANLNIVKAVR